MWLIIAISYVVQCLMTVHQYSVTDAEQFGIYNIPLYSVTVSGKVQACKLCCKTSILSVTCFVKLMLLDLVFISDLFNIFIFSVLCKIVIFFRCNTVI